MLRALYRALLREALLFDAQPSMKSLIHRTPLCFEIPLARGLSTPLLADRVLGSALKGGLLYTPQGAPTFASIVKAAFRAPVGNELLPDGDARHESEDDEEEEEEEEDESGMLDRFRAELHHHNSDETREEDGIAVLERISVSKRVDVALELLRRLAEARHHAKGMTRVLRGDSFAGIKSVGQAHKVKVGSLLISHPLLDNDFRESVILVTHVGRRMVHGVIVNQPLSRIGVVGDVLTKESDSKVADLLQHFSSNLMLRGGPVGENVQILHPYPIDDAHKVASGLYLGGMIDDAVHLIQTQMAGPEDFLFVQGVTSWSVSQLEQELKNGFWFPFSPVSSRSKAVSKVVFSRGDMWRRVLQSAADLADMGVSPPMRYDR